MPKVAGSKRKMDDTCPTFALKTTTDKFKTLDNNDPVSYDSEDYSAAATDTLTCYYCTDSDYKHIINYDRTECDNAATITSKPTMLKKEWKDPTETNKLPNIVNDRFCDPAEEDDQ